LPCPSILGLYDAGSGYPAYLPAAGTRGQDEEAYQCTHPEQRSKKKKTKSPTG